MGRKVFAIIDVDDDMAIEEDKGTGEYLEKEIECLKQNGISLEEWLVSDEDDVEKWARYIDYLIEWAFEHSDEECKGMFPDSYDKWCKKDEDNYDATIKHVKGDIFQSSADVILHQVNCQGVMGSGVAKQVREKYPLVYEEYKSLCDNTDLSKDLLGTAQLVITDTDYDTPFLGIYNLFGQDRFGYDGECYTDYDALRKCLEEVRSDLPLDDNKYTIAIPYLMGCYRGGGDWNVVYSMIKEIFAGYDVTLYEYKGD